MSTYPSSLIPLYINALYFLKKRSQTCGSKWVDVLTVAQALFME